MKLSEDRDRPKVKGTVTPPAGMTVEQMNARARAASERRQREREDG